MPDYHKMYLHLFNEVTRAINILQDAQATAEEMYISSKESTITLSDNLPFQPDEDPDNDTDPEQTVDEKSSFA